MARFAFHCIPPSSFTSRASLCRSHSANMHRCPSLLRSLQRTFALPRALPATRPGTTTRTTTSNSTLSQCQQLYSRRLHTFSATIEGAAKPKTIKPKPRIPRNPHKSVKWTHEMDETVLSLRNQQKTWDYIAMVVGRPSSACSDRFYTCLDPALRNWTPAMFNKLDEMVEAGYAWREIANTLGSIVITCQYQWRTLGKGKYRISGLGLGIRARAQEWSPIEVDSYWRSFLQHGQGKWEQIADDVHSKSADECKIGFKALVLAALKDCPGWVKIEINNYVAQTSRQARQRAQVAEGVAAEAETEAGTAMNTIPETATLSAESTATETTTTPSKPVQTPTEAWTAAEHNDLLKAVEKHGLFSGWTKIRKEVKAELRDDEVEAEYYRLNGVMDNTQVVEDEHVGSATSLNSLSYHTSPSTPHTNKSEDDGTWTDDELGKLYKMLMRYSPIPIWQEEAERLNYKPTEEEERELLWPAHVATEKKKKNKKNKKEIANLQKQLQDQLQQGTSSNDDEDNYSSNSNNPDDDEVQGEDEGLDAVDDDTLAAISSTAPTHIEWTKERVERLKRLVGQQRLQGSVSGHPVDWDWIADHIGPGFDANMCISAWQSSPKKEVARPEPAKYWDEVDLELLMHGVRVHGRAWSKIKKEFLTDRTTDSIRRKVSNLEKNRNRLVRETKKLVPKDSLMTAQDVNDFVDDALKEYEVYTICKKLDRLFDEYRENLQRKQLLSSTSPDTTEAAD